MITLNCDRIEPAAKKKRQRTPDRRFNYGKTIGRRKLQLKCKFCFVFQRSFADEFSVSCALFRHEQHVSLRLSHSVLSDIIISWNEQFCSTKKVISRRNISITNVADLQNIQPLSHSSHFSLTLVRYRFVQVEIVSFGLTPLTLTCPDLNSSLNQLESSLATLVTVHD